IARDRVRRVRGAVQAGATAASDARRADNRVERVARLRAPEDRAGRRLDPVPGRPGHLDRAAEARAGGHPGLADRAGGAAVPGLRRLLLPGPAEDRPPAAPPAPVAPRHA